MDELKGVWKLTNLGRKDEEVITGKTHLVIRDNDLWEVWPKQTYYDRPPNRTYEVVWRDGFGYLKMTEGNPFKYVVQVENGTLKMRLGGVLGQFPSGIDDDYGVLSTYVRESDIDTVERLSTPPETQPRPSKQHPLIGTLVFDGNVDWWTGQIDVFGETAIISFDSDVKDENYESFILKIHNTALDDVKRSVADKLLKNYNDNWNDEDDGKEISSTEFTSRLSLRSITIHGNDRTYWFDDGYLFGGHQLFICFDVNEDVVDAGF